MKHIAHALLPALLAAVTMTASAPLPAIADGGYLSPAGYYFYEPAQTAFIRYDAAEDTETLSIYPSFWGEPADFAWVVPIPSLPTVTEDDPDLFLQLNAAASPAIRHRDSFWGCDERRDYLVGAPGDGVVIVDEKFVGIYRTMTLAADEASALTDSLTTWGFLHEDNRDAFLPILQGYVDEGWYFVTMVIDSASVAEVQAQGASLAIKAAAAPVPPYNGIQPVRFTFASPDIVYPLRISATSTYGANQVNIYVAADHRMDFPEARTVYANRITAGELAGIRRTYPQLGAELWDGAFLTKLYRGYTPEEMDNDVILTPADTDDEFLIVRQSGLPVWTVVFGGTILWWLVRKRRRPLNGS